MGKGGVVHLSALRKAWICLRELYHIGSFYFDGHSSLICTVTLINDFPAHLDGIVRPDWDLQGWSTVLFGRGGRKRDRKESLAGEWQLRHSLGQRRWSQRWRLVSKLLRVLWLSSFPYWRIQWRWHSIWWYCQLWWWQRQHVGWWWWRRLGVEGLRWIIYISGLEADHSINASWASVCVSLPLSSSSFLFQSRRRWFSRWGCEYKLRFNFSLGSWPLFGRSEETVLRAFLGNDRLWLWLWLWVTLSCSSHPIGYILPTFPSSCQPACTICRLLPDFLNFIYPQQIVVVGGYKVYPSLSWNFYNILIVNMLFKWIYMIRKKGKILWFFSFEDWG